MNVDQRISIPCQTRFENIQPADEEDKSKGVIIRGKLIRCNVPTRNGISYTNRSMAKFIENFNNSGKSMPFLDSHDDSSIRKSPPFGHVTKLFMNGDDVFYEANIDPDEKIFLHKLKRGDISEVSLQAIVDAVDERESLNGDNVITADVKELLEISSVLIPGARDTSSEIQESFISEKRFVETFYNAKKNRITFKESLQNLKNKEMAENGKEDEEKMEQEAIDNNELAGGQVKIKDKEDLDSNNAGALKATGLPEDKKIRQSEILMKSKLLKLNTWKLC